MTDKEQLNLLETIRAVERRLGTLEDLVAFLVRADRKGISDRTKGRVRTGRVIEIDDTFSIKVLLDGYKKPHSYHHMFFDPADS